jgi:hypothetical protein
MMKIYAAAHGIRWTLISAIFAGLLLAGGFGTIYQFALEEYDEANHVLLLNAQVVTLDNDSVVIQANGEKLRACQYIRLQAYTLQKNGELLDAQIMRVDQPEDDDVKPLGKFNFGRWKIWPRDGAVGLQVFSQYLCGQRMVVNKVVDLTLPKAPA